ncbi:MAG: hypothetical protein Q8P59_06510 [Dehalococcoidia bacterium]|nr:hypothetical protein [Dehalococcoidia bacterium]
MKLTLVNALGAELVAGFGEACEPEDDWVGGADAAAQPDNATPNIKEISK